MKKRMFVLGSSLLGLAIYSSAALARRGSFRGGGGKTTASSGNERRVRPFARADPSMLWLALRADASGWCV